MPSIMSTVVPGLSTFWLSLLLEPVFGSRTLHTHTHYSGAGWSPVTADLQATLPPLIP